VAAEALLRWNNPELGFIPPDKFIPIAEETRMILPIGAFVFEEACKAFLQWRKHCLDIEIIAINVSSIQLAQPDLLETFTEIITRLGISASNIEIEITERYIFECVKGGSTILNDLQKLGFKIAIDDFGTGYSSMNYLMKLPLDTIKIDKSFVDEVPHNHNNVEVTKAIIALSKSLGYANVAEGIETQEQEDFLRDQGCQIGQGYYFQRPISHEDFVDFCKNCV
jgi:EAL domain-containing protein (putative c-di-GMP-specific phosphodiesterase class I)